MRSRTGKSRTEVFYKYLTNEKEPRLLLFYLEFLSGVLTLAPIDKYITP